MLAIAMGIQNAVLTRFSSLTLHTGFVTGTLLKGAEQLVQFGAWMWDALRGGQRLHEVLVESRRQSTLRGALLLAITWMAYVLGAGSGALSRKTLHANSLLIAIAGLGFLIMVDFHSPLASQDEMCRWGD